MVTSKVSRRGRSHGGISGGLVYNVAAEPLSGFLLERRIEQAYAYYLHGDAPALTLRALEAFDPCVLWLLLKHLGDLPEPPPPRSERLRNENLENAHDAELDHAKDRLDRARSSGRPELIAMAAQMLDETKDRLLRVPRARRKGIRGESAFRRTRALRALMAGLVGWSRIDIARLVLESTRAWRRPPCPDLVDEFDGIERSLAHQFGRDLERR